VLGRTPRDILSSRLVVVPIEYEIDEEREMVRTTARGVLTSAELLAHVRRLATDDALPRPLYEIWDGTDVDRLDARGTNVRGFINAAAAARDKFGPARLAIVAPTPVVFGLARMAQALAEFTPFRIAVFHDREDADAWMAERMAERDAVSSANASTAE
jgi:hypothetical protein